MNTKRIILSLGMLVFVGGVVISGTGAFFSSTATNTGNTFAAGTLELTMAHNENGNYESSKPAAWTFTNMTPGGTPEVEDIWLQNEGSVDGMKLGVAMDNASASEPGTAAQMRITEMTLDGDPLLEGGAGANLAAYEAPASCDATVTGGGNGIQTAINAASAGDVICVDAGVYDEFQVGTADLTIAGLNNPNSASAAIVQPSAAGVTQLALVDVDGVTITGLRFDGNGMALNGNQTAGILIIADGNDVDGTTVSYNLIRDLHATNANASSKGVQWHDDDGAFALTNAVIEHNVIRDIDSDAKGGYGIQTVGVLNNVAIDHNTILDVDGAWGAGIALDDKTAAGTAAVTVTNNQLTNNLWNDVSVQVEHNVDQNGITISQNNLVGVVHGGAGTEATGNAVNAENNWWGDFDPSDQVYGPVDFDPFAGGPFAGLVNGNDWNGNGFADLQDLNNDPILGANVGLDAGEKKLFVMGVQLDGPTTGNEFQGASLTTDIVFTLQQQ